MGYGNEPQLQVSENYSHLLDLRPHVLKSWCLNTHFISTNSDFAKLMKQIWSDCTRLNGSWDMIENNQSK